ncbi:hypothetical protein BYT27DRAFT_7249642 [Phlegmacium glaucopus]|nr:hypothetical protein BYT27DRAFT_7249642 [Phlegmacium glaucopus]
MKVLGIFVPMGLGTTTTLNFKIFAKFESPQLFASVQFRLLREAIIWPPLRQAIHEVHDDLKSKSLKRIKLGDLFDKKGGSVQFLSLIPGWNGISTSLLVDTPPGQGGAERSSQQATFREIHLSIIASSTQDLSDYVKQNKEHVKL